MTIFYEINVGINSVMIAGILLYRPYPTTPIVPTELVLSSFVTVDVLKDPKRFCTIPTF